MKSSINENLEKIQRLQQIFYPTPLLEITLKYKNRELKLYAKSEICNFSGSVKDRMVAHILQQCYLNGNLKTGDKIIEVSSGCTGIALTTLGKFLGHEVEIVIPDWFSQTRYAMLEILGAQVRKISREEGGFFKCMEIAKEKSQEKGTFYLSQFDNKLNVEAHFESLAPELFNGLEKLKLNNKFVFSAGVGSGGTLIGIHQYCLKNKIDCLCFAMEPESSPLFRSHGKKFGEHRIEGIADDFIPQNCDLDEDLFKEIIPIHDGDAILLAQKLNKCGVSAGISSGGNFLATLHAAEKSDFTRIPVTVFPDGAIKYTSTDLFKSEPVRAEYMSPNVEILAIKLV